MIAKILSVADRFAHGTAQGLGIAFGLYLALRFVLWVTA